MHMYLHPTVNYWWIPSLVVSQQAWDLHRSIDPSPSQKKPTENSLAKDVYTDQNRFFISQLWKYSCALIFLFEMEFMLCILFSFSTPTQWIFPYKICHRESMYAWAIPWYTRDLTFQNLAFGCSPWNITIYRIYVLIERAIHLFSTYRSSFI